MEGLARGVDSGRGKSVGVGGGGGEIEKDSLRGWVVEVVCDGNGDEELVE